ncbi:MAG TPA: LytTR family DNA-binding domain-containing protein [Candidatus Mediterraneibacter merdavium]|nr:LytTR family DNA-binding domain-containing protein [Candidatus Mediterraneibacter merdavium]
MLKIAIVEDEESYISVLQEYLKKYEQDTGEDIEVTVYHDGDEIAAFYRAQFDVILMDIEMKFIDGMTAAEEIRKVDSTVSIIFITNAPQYAIRGYEVGALDYILKPVPYFTFSQKLGRAVEKLKKRERKWITVQVKGGVMRMELADIYYIESQGHDLIYHTKDGTPVAGSTMKSVEDRMTEMDFFRINKCYLVNLEHVEGVQDKYAVVHGERLLISRPRMKQFMQELTRYWGGRS